MRVVVDGLPVRGDNSLSIVLEHLLAGWEQLDNGDEVHLVIRSDPAIAIPESVVVHEVKFGRLAFLSRLYAQSVKVPRLCRILNAEILLGVLPATTVTPLPCPRAIVVYDMRYKLRPEQFGKKALLLRKLSYRVGFSQADAMICISERTRQDLLKAHRRAERSRTRVAHLGADHVDAWPVRESSDEYALAFGHFNNKNVDLVLESWGIMRSGGRTPLPLRLVGLSDEDRPRIEQRIRDLGLEELVTALPWLSTESFQETFASSSLVVFPSEFEGFGLPAVEAMRLGIPLVISAEPALLEVTAGHASVMDGETPEALGKAVEKAGVLAAEDLAAARRHAERFTWRNFAADVRASLAHAVSVRTYGTEGTEGTEESRGLITSSKRSAAPSGENSASA